MKTVAVVDYDYFLDTAEVGVTYEPDLDVVGIRLDPFARYRPPGAGAGSAPG